MVKDLKISFPDGNIINQANSTCSSPNTLMVDIEDLIPGRKYTVFIKNLNTTPAVIFPESFSFVAAETTKRLSFYYEFA
jgi:hypothetical protein